MQAKRRTQAHFDGAGHLNPEHRRRLVAETLETRSQMDEGLAFFEVYHTRENIGEELGESFVSSATSGQNTESERHEELVPEEWGGPFIEINASREFAPGTDASNIAEATREPFPRAFGDEGSVEPEDSSRDEYYPYEE